MSNPVIRRRKVDMYAVEALCNALSVDLKRCEGQFQAVAQIGNNFRHKCSICGRETHYNEPYPKMDHVLVEESSNEVVSVIQP